MFDGKLCENNGTSKSFWVNFVKTMKLPKASILINFLEF